MWRVTATDETEPYSDKYIILSSCATYIGERNSNLIKSRRKPYSIKSLYYELKERVANKNLWGAAGGFSFLM
jgi:hypothetical protein